jgi:hypothetical protein
MSRRVLSTREQEHLAVLRVAAMAADPAEVRMQVRRADVLAVLAAVDRLSQSVSVESVVVLHGQVPGLFATGSNTIHQHGCDDSAGQDGMCDA